MNTPLPIVRAVVAAQVLVQLGTFAMPALLPEFILRWTLSATEAGWLIGAFFAAYVVAVPILVALTDRFPARHIYIVGAAMTAISHFGFALAADGFWSGLVLRAMAGVGWAGCYMPGLKVIADQLEGEAQSRAVSWHAAGVGIAGAASFAIAGLLYAAGGMMAVFLFGGLAACAALAIGLAVMPARMPRRPADAPPPTALLDFRPVWRNRAAMAWITGYTVHTWELAALRAWAVTFLTAAIATNGMPGWLPGPTFIFTAAGLLGIAVSIIGNETAQHFGRARIVAFAIGAAAVMALMTGWAGHFSYLLAVLCVLLWNAAIYLDSSALTAGTVQAAGPGLRGATMGLHSMCGYAGGFLGPLGVGVVLDMIGPGNAFAWGLAFGHISIVTLIGLYLLRRFSPPA